jgi:hypothetical protein
VVVLAVMLAMVVVAVNIAGSRVSHMCFRSRVAAVEAVEAVAVAVLEEAAALVEE